MRRFGSPQEIVADKATYESWNFLAASERLFSNAPVAFQLGYEATAASGDSIGLCGLTFSDDSYSYIGGAVHPAHRGKGIGRSLLERMLSELPRTSRVMVSVANPDTGAPSLLCNLGFVCTDAGRVETFVHELDRARDLPTLHGGYKLSHTGSIDQQDLAAVIELEREWCKDMDQPFGPRLVTDYRDPAEGFAVLARDSTEMPVGIASADLSNVEGLGMAGIFAVLPAHRRKGLGFAIKSAQLNAAREVGWIRLLVTVPSSDHPAARINTVLGGRGISGVKWVRPAIAS